MKNIYLILACAGLLAMASCKKHNDNCDSLGQTPVCPYTDPIWHPSGKVIGFNHIPVTTVTYTGSGCNLNAEYSYRRDSIGFWLINSDGTNQRRILPYTLVTPSWSADGKWLAFANGGDIFKMPFDGQKLDTNSIVRLTFNGNNYSPSWNYQSNKIVYDESVCNGVNSCGIWLYDSNNISNANQFLIAYGADPSWLYNSNSFLYHKGYLDRSGNQLGDSVWVYSSTTHQTQFLKALNMPYVVNRIFQASPDGSKIAFISGVYAQGEQLCIMNFDGTGLSQLTTTGVTGFTWGPDGRMVYINFDTHTLDLTHGTLWIMNADGSKKTELTYNRLN